MATIIRTSEGDLLDHLCLSHYGHLDGVVEGVLSANPGLAAQVEPYPLGLYIVMPDLPSASTETVTLWE
ncbi:MAG: tail protein X [Pseudogulbenkiania sp.]|nr:tail protein X [Pseudogulbenkiania sp.]